MKRILSIIFALMMSVFICVSVCADTEFIDEGLEEIGDEQSSTAEECPEGSSAGGSYGWLDLLPSPDDLPISSKVPESESSQSIFDQSLFQYDVMPLDNTYGGAWSSAVSDYFEGYVLSNSPFEHYFALRSSQYVYDLYCGNIKYNNGYYSGTNLIRVSYNTYNSSNSNDYITFYSGATLNFSGGDGIFYSDLQGGASYSSVAIVRFVCGVGVVLVVMLIVRLFGRFFR